MKPIITATAIVTALASPALAGGYATSIIAAPGDPYAFEQEPSFSWTGPYLGLQAGHTKLRLKQREVTRDPDTIIEHPPVVETLTIEHPEVTKEVHHPEETVTKEVVTHHPPEVEIRETKIEHAAEVEKVKVGEEKLWLPGTPDMVGYNGETGLAPVPDPDHPSGWAHVDTYEERTVREAWTETRQEAVVVREGWTETSHVEEVVREAYTETVVISPAATETKEVVVREAWSEVIPGAWGATLIHNLRDNTNTYGAFAGYRHQFGNSFVLGAEYNYLKSEGVKVENVGEFDFDTHSVEAQLGYAMGKWLPYVAAGYAKADERDGWLAAAGVDYAVTDNILIGAKFTHYDYGSVADTLTADQQTFAVRIGFKF